MDKEQHFLNVKDKELESILVDILKIEQVDNIIELGAGKGDFTKTFMNSGCHILSYEIESSFRAEFEKNTINATFYVRDIIDNIYMDEKDIIVSAPPYTLLPFINEKYIKPKNMRYILMVSERCLKLFKDYKIIYNLFPDDFIPQSKGKHFIITNI